MTDRDFKSHVLQLCDYVEDLRIESGLLALADYCVLRAKANQVRTLSLEE